ncbi:hypothetical protein O3M35_001833 [Rhynocoris fuscipes]|uniref:Uncharacterized protein n=1 Tax=Rhynocoris fuscipes TaxID=488301 RepID=A0AAW1CSL1_9HEMI
MKELGKTYITILVNVHVLPIVDCLLSSENKLWFAKVPDDSPTPTSQEKEETSSSGSSSGSSSEDNDSEDERSAKLQVLQEQHLVGVLLMIVVFLSQPHITFCKLLDSTLSIGYN